MRQQIVICILIFNLGVAYSQNDCDKYSDNYIPKNLNDAISYLDCTWSDVDKEEFKNKNEEDAVAELHFGTGLAIRNNWELWKRGKNRLELFFNIRGISHPDDISSIILTSFHRHLNNKDIELKAQIKYYKQYWKKAKKRYEDEQRLLTEKLKIQYDKYGIGDTILIAYKIYPPYKKGGLMRVHSVQGYPDLNENWNCPVTGLVVGKKIRKGKDYTLIVKITDICEHTEVFWLDIYEKFGHFKVGEQYDFFSLRYYKITRK
jgi:hypothetical protein